MDKYRIYAKINRIIGILVDKSEAFDDNRAYRWEIIWSIIKEK
jgi:hypothetical protein